MRKIIDFFHDVKDSVRDNDSFRESGKLTRFAYIGVVLLVIFLVIGGIVASTVG